MSDKWRVWKSDVSAASAEFKANLVAMKVLLDEFRLNLELSKQQGDEKQVARHLAAGRLLGTRESALNVTLIHDE